MGEWLNIVTCPYHEVLLSKKTEQTTITCNNLDRSEGHYIEKSEKQPFQRLHITQFHLYNIPEMTEL